MLCGRITVVTPVAGVGKHASELTPLPPPRNSGALRGTERTLKYTKTKDRQQTQGQPTGLLVLVLSAARFFCSVPRFRMVGCAQTSSS